MENSIKNFSSLRGVKVVRRKNKQRKGDWDWD